MRRVVVTGMGVVSALGNSVADSWKRLSVYQNAVKHLDELEKYRGLNARLGAPITDFQVPENFNRKMLRTMGPVSVMAVCSAEEALTQAGLLNHPVLTSGRTGVAYGSSWGR